MHTLIRITLEAMHLYNSRSTSVSQGGLPMRESKGARLQDRCLSRLRPLVLIFLFGMPLSHASSLANCIAKEVTFSGVPGLQYARVMGAEDSHLDIYTAYPQNCSKGMKACRGEAYVIPGDDVAIGKVCAGWAYVQYLGKRRITAGWVEASRLAFLPAVAAPNPPRDPYTKVGGVHPWPAHYRFTLTKGRDRPVCEAYLQRLNQTEFFRPPYCGRPESTVVPGFVALRRQYLAAQEILHLAPRVNNFMNGIPQDRPDLSVEIGQNGVVKDASGRPIKVPGWRLHDITDAMDLQVWRYTSEVDIDNDGIPDNMIMWHGFGASNADTVCGALYANNPEGQYAEQRAFILTADGTRIDEARTKAVFGRPSGGYVGMINGKPSYAQGFTPIGYSIGMFQYESTYYFDAFFNPDFGDFYDRRRNDEGLRYVLGVFEHKSRRTRQVCEYQEDGAVPGEFLNSPGLRKPE